LLYLLTYTNNVPEVATQQGAMAVCKNDSDTRKESGSGETPRTGVKVTD